MKRVYFVAVTRCNRVTMQFKLNGLLKAGAKSCFFVVACLFLCCVVPVVTNGENVRNDGETQTPYICTRLYWDFVRKIKKGFPRFLVCSVCIYFLF